VKDKADQRLRIGFLASGNGSSARAIVEAIAAGEIGAEAVVMVSNSRKAPALDWARAAGLAAHCIPTAADPSAADAQLAQIMSQARVGLIILSGYLRRLGPQTLARYAGRILNIHPGPLPAFGGQGMYGRRVHEAVVAAGVAQSGMTIHLVDEEYDHGPVVAERSVPVRPEDTAESLEARIKALEPAFFVETLKAVSEGRLRLLSISDNLP